MSVLNIGVVVGSNSQKSINRKLAQALVQLVPADQAQFTFLDIQQLPLYSYDMDGTDAFAPFAAFKAEIAKCHGILFVTPEYNRSIPAALKNAIDAASRPYGQSAWGGLPAAVIGTSPGGAATCMAQQHLRNVLANQDMTVMGQPEGFIQWNNELIDASGQVGPKSKDFLTKYMTRFVQWVQKHPKG